MTEKFYTNVIMDRGKYYVRGYESDGSQFVERDDSFQHNLFIPSSHTTESNFKTLHGKPLKGVSFSSFGERRKFIDKYKDVDGVEIHGVINPTYEYTYKKYRHVEPDFSRIRVLNYDIETDSSKGFISPSDASVPILSIAVSCSKVNCRDYARIVFCTRHTTPERIKYPESKVMVYETEAMMLKAFCEFWKKFSPDIITGWNIDGYDTPFTINRILRLIESGEMSENDLRKLSPFRLSPVEKRFTKYGNGESQYDIRGVASIDYMVAYKTFTYKERESMKLDYIAYVELGEKKLDYSEYSSLHKLYQEDFDKFIQYNLKDVILVDQLDERLGLFELILGLSYDSGVNYEDTYFQTRIWESICYAELMDKGIAIPPKKENEKSSKYSGGFVKEPHVGLHDWVVSFDLNSLYPNIIIQYNISPEKMLDKDGRIDVETMLSRQGLPIKPGQTICANGQKFDVTSVGFISELLKKFYDQRSEYKAESKRQYALYQETGKEEHKRLAERLDNKQLARKICLNSYYGSMGTPYFRFYDIDMAEAVTTTGQYIIRSSEKAINAFLNKSFKTTDVDYVIAMDTDSIYVSCDSFVDMYLEKNKYDKDGIVSYLDTLSDRVLSKVLEDCFENIFNYTQAIENRMVMKRENIASKAIWTAKKHYLMEVDDSEGVRYETPSLKVMGIESIKSTTPEVCRDAFEDCYRIILSGDRDKLHRYVFDFKKRFNALRPEEVASSKSVSEITKWTSGKTLFIKGTPVHVKGAILYNTLLHDLGLTLKYEKITEGNKLKWMYLREPMYGCNSISFPPHYLPDELGLRDKIDYDAQFNKMFLEPLHIILDILGWNVRTETSLRSKIRIRS